jgi:PTH2 family peptidyl-tRNA hydrolase
MTPGKAASQAGHAFLEAFITADPETRDAYFDDGGGTKVALQAPGIDDLQRTYDLAKDAGIPCALVIESGHIMPPTFDGRPVITALGLGPVDRSKARSLTKRFRLMA